MEAVGNRKVIHLSQYKNLTVNYIIALRTPILLASATDWLLMVGSKDVRDISYRLFVKWKTTALTRYLGQARALDS